jgi:thioredoxin 1
MSQYLEKIDDESFAREVLGSNLPFLLDFGAVWCAPCRALEPILEELAREQHGRLRVGKIDIDDSSLIASRLGIRGAPTLVLFRSGKEVARRIGLIPKRALLELVGAGDAAGRVSAG